MRCKLDEILKPGDIARVAEKTNIHRNTITRYKNNERLPRIDHAYRIAEAVGRSVYEIWPPN